MFWGVELECVMDRNCGEVEEARKVFDAMKEIGRAHV